MNRDFLAINALDYFQVFYYLGGVCGCMWMSVSGTWVQILFFLPRFAENEACEYEQMIYIIVY